MANITTTIGINADTKNLLEASIQKIYENTLVDKMTYSEYIGKIIRRFGAIFEADEIAHYSPIQYRSSLTEEEEEEILNEVNEKYNSK